MPYTTLSWWSGPVGAAQSINLEPPSTIIVVTDIASQAAAVVSAVTAGNCWIIFLVSGQTWTLTAQLVPGSNVAIFCPLGWWRLDCSHSNLTNTTGVLLSGVTDVFFGNPKIKTGAGVDTGNNPHGAVEITGACRRIYFLNPTAEYTDTSSFSQDTPEWLNIWNNDSNPDNGPQEITIQNLATPSPAPGHTKVAIIGGTGTTSASGCWVTFFEGYSETHQRSPLVKTAAKADMVNFVWVVDGDRIHGMLIQDSTSLGLARGCFIGRTGDSTLPQRQEIDDESGNNRAYAPSSGAGNTNNIPGPGTLPANAGNQDPEWENNYTGLVSIPYTLNPAAMSESYAAEVMARSGAGNVIIQYQESAGRALLLASRAM